MYGPRYSCSFTATAATAAVDFFEITPATNKIIVVHAIYISQTTELGDTAEEQLEIEIQRGGTAMTSGSGGNAAANGVAVAGSGTAPTSGFTFESMNTTAATFTSGLFIHREPFNVRTGWQFRPTPEERPVCSAANGGLSIGLAAAPADSISWSGTVIVEEIG